MSNIPASVSHADFLAAIQPLLDLMNVTADQIGGDDFIISDQSVRFTLFLPDESGSRQCAPPVQEPGPRAQVISTRIVVKVRS